MKFIHLTDEQLINLFTVLHQGQYTVRGNAILSELRHRGYIFSYRRGQFLSEAQWKQYYDEPPPTPADYAAHLQQYAAQLDKVSHSRKQRQEEDTTP